eukprot:GSMAST32.ASY1.ANO1.1581.1 assembled CDS
MIKAIKNAVTIPVMAKARIGHFVEAQILEAIEVDFIDETLRRISEGAAMMRTKGEAGTGNIVEAVRHARAVNSEVLVNFAAGGVATPADAALMMQLGLDGVFVGSGIFKSENPRKRANAIVQAVTHYNNPKMLAELSENLGGAMVGISDLKKDGVNFRDREAGQHKSVHNGLSAPHGCW